MAGQLRRIDVPVALDRYGDEVAIGLLLLATDNTTERDFRRLFPTNKVAVYANRIDYANPTTPKSLRAMQPHLTQGAARILPGQELAAIYYACTAASVVMGDEVVERAIAAAKPSSVVITPPAAARRALKALGATRISILTPYTRQTSRPLIDYFSRHGFEVAGLGYLGFEDDREMARITLPSIVDAAVEATAGDADALFVSCTALRAAEVAATIEEKIGRPVVTSNQASIWACLGAAKIEHSISSAGRLFSLSLPPAAA